MAAKGIGMVQDISHTDTGNTFSMKVKFSAIDTATAEGLIDVIVASNQTPAQIRATLAAAVRDKLVNDYGYVFTPAVDSVVLMCADFNVITV